MFIAEIELASLQGSEAGKLLKPVDTVPNPAAIMGAKSNVSRLSEAVDLEELRIFKSHGLHPTHLQAQGLVCFSL